VFKLLADLDPKGRMARLLVSLPDPLPQDKILLGSFVRVLIEAGQLEKVFFLP
jgi:hypothetical protein